MRIAALDAHHSADRRRPPSAWLRMMIKVHDHYAVMLVIVAHLVMNVLEMFNRAEFGGVITDPLLTAVVSSPTWVIFSVFTAVWLILFRTPPKVVWGLWASTAMFSTWGALNLVIGVTASSPVSLAGPALMLFVIAPLAWFAADAFEDRVVTEQTKDRTTFRDLSVEK